MCRVDCPADTFGKVRLRQLPPRSDLPYTLIPAILDCQFGNVGHENIMCPTIRLLVISALIFLCFFS